MAESPYQINTARENNPNAEFISNIEHNTETVELEKVA